MVKVDVDVDVDVDGQTWLCYVTAQNTQEK